MNVATEIEIYQYEQDEIDECFMAWSSLWYSDFEEAGVKKCFVAWIGDDAVAFQTVDIDGLCIAIETRKGCEGQGLATALIQESGCYRPAENENPEFWAAIGEKFGG